MKWHPHLSSSYSNSQRKLHWTQAICRPAKEYLQVKLMSGMGAVQKHPLGKHSSRSRAENECFTFQYQLLVFKILQTGPSVHRQQWEIQKTSCREQNTITTRETSEVKSKPFAFLTCYQAVSFPPDENGIMFIRQSQYLHIFHFAIRFFTSKDVRFPRGSQLCMMWPKE